MLDADLAAHERLDPLGHPILKAGAVRTATVPLGQKLALSFGERGPVVVRPDAVGSAAVSQQRVGRRDAPVLARERRVAADRASG